MSAQTVPLSICDDIESKDSDFCRQVNGCDINWPDLHL